MSLWEYYSNVDYKELRRDKNSMLYCAAKIDENNIVTDTIVVDESDISDENGLSDSLTTTFANSIRQTTGTWKWAGMYQEDQGSVRHIEPGIGDNWDPNISKFYQKKPHASWVLNDNLDWEPPMARPNNTTKWMWNEELQTWELPNQAFEVSTNYYNETPGDPDNDNYVGRAED